MAQSAARKSHILKIGVRSSLVSVCHGNTYWRRKTSAIQKMHGKLPDNYYSGMPHQRTRLQKFHWWTIKETAAMAQSAARKSHNLKVVSSILTCLSLSRQYILEAKNQRQPKDARKIARQLLLRNAASTYKAPKTPLMDHNGDSYNGAVGSA